MSEQQKAQVEHSLGLYGFAWNDALKPEWRQLFKQEKPIVLEIGFGMGKSLLETAETFPNYNYVGIEVHRPGIANVLKAIHHKQLEHIKIIEGNAVEVLQQFVPDKTLDKICIFFPDPWPKKRHHKRRLIQAEFVSLLSAKLKTGGILHLATDWEHYAMHMLEVLSQETSLTNCAGQRHFSDRPAERPLTKFEARGLKLGHQVWDLLFQKS